MAYNVERVKAKLNQKIEAILSLDAGASRAQIIDCGLFLEALRSIEQVEREYREAVDVIMAVEDLVFLTKEAAAADVPYLTPVVNITKIEKALGREENV